MALFGSGSKTKTIKIEVSEDVWERLTFYMQQTSSSAEVAIGKILDRNLPNITGNLIRVLERMSDEDRLLFEESFYTVMYMVSYSDHDFSLRESLEIDRRLHRLRDTFGKQFTTVMDIEKSRKDTLLEAIKAMEPAQVPERLAKLRAVLEKMPPNLVEEYKRSLMDAALLVAGASREGVLGGERISKEEKGMIQTIVTALEIPLDAMHAKAVLSGEIGGIG